MIKGAVSPKREAIRAVRALLAAGGTAALAVREPATGHPFTTLVNFAADRSLRPLLLLSSLAHHSACLAADPVGSLLVHAPIAETGDPMLTLRVTLSGQFEPVFHEDAAIPFLARHAYAELYAGFGDFKFWRLQAEHAHIIAGFGRAYQVRFQDIAADITA
jgi:heme iron utilization protein